MIRFVLDGTAYNSSNNWKELKSRFLRDDKNNTILVTTDGKYEFSDDAFTYISNKADTSGFCDEIEVSVQENCDGSYREIITGNMFISDTEINERTCTVESTIQDNSFYAKIANNRKIKTSPDAGKDKNGNSITQATTYNMDVYSISANTLLFNNVPAVRVEEAFRYLVDFMSEGQLGFVSDTFGVGGEFEGLCIVSGERLRTVSATAFPIFSFEQLVKEINCRIPIVIAIEKTINTVQMRVESWEYFNQTSTTFTFDDVNEIRSRFETTKLYSVLKMGGPVDTSILIFPEGLPFFGMKDEEFGVLGICNIDNVLDLSYQWISSNNIIYQVTVNGDQNYDSDIFVFDTTLTDATNGRTTNSNYLGFASPLYHYNERLTNYNITTRYFEKVPNSIAAYFDATGNGTFKAYSTYAATIIVPGTINAFPFTNVVSNIGSFYDGTDTFTATDLGVYNFFVNLDVNIANVNTGIVMGLYMRQFNSSNVLIGEHFIDTVNATANGIWNLSGTVSTVMSVGDYMNVKWTIISAVAPISLTFSNSSYWECTSTSLDGGLMQTYNPDDYPVRIHEFDYPLTQAEYESIIASPYGFVRFAMTGQQYRKGYLKELQYDHITGIASVKVITNKSTINAT